MMVRIGPITLLFFLTAACGFIPYGGDKTPQIKLEEVVFDSMHIGGAQDRPCGIIEARYSPGRDKKSIEQWRATARPNARWLGSDDLHNGVFVGIAISGGGSRSANFALATLLELDKLGVLNYVSAISSVSGGSIAAAYYGLFGKNITKWNLNAVKKPFREDMQWHGLLRWLWPQNLVLTGLTEYTRTQIMAETIDDTFFQGNTFSALDPTLPVILINSTELSPGGCSMVFSAENFNAMHADLSAYPIANAVMASGAFPGAFNPITLSNWASPVQRTWLGTKRATWFRHLYDGGPSDNLGTDALLREVSRLRDDGIRVRDCFLFVIDAFPDAFFSLDKPETSDSRSLVDFFVDTNALTASDTLLAKARLNQLLDLGIANPRTQSFHQPDGEQGGFRGCTIRLIALQHLKALRRVDVVKQSEASRFSVCKKEGMACLVNSIPTAYKLSNAEDRNQTSDDVQAALFEAAHELVWQDALPPSANTSFTVEQVGNPTMMAMLLRQGSDPVSLYLRERLTEKQRDILQRSCCQKSSRELTVAILEFLRNEQHDSGLWSPQRFRNVNLRDQTKVLLAGFSLKDDQLLLLNRLLLEDAYPDLLDRTRNVHKSTCRWFSNNGMPLQGCA